MINQFVALVNQLEITFTEAVYTDSLNWLEPGYSEFRAGVPVAFHRILSGAAFP